MTPSDLPPEGRELARELLTVMLEDPGAQETREDFDRVMDEILAGEQPLLASTLTSVAFIAQDAIGELAQARGETPEETWQWLVRRHLH